MSLKPPRCLIHGLVVAQESTSTGSPRVGFSHKLVCDGQDNSLVARIAGATDLGFDTSGRLRVIVNVSLDEEGGGRLFAEDADTVRPEVATRHDAVAKVRESREGEQFRSEPAAPRDCRYHGQPSERRNGSFLPTAKRSWFNRCSNSGTAIR
jgi:hypothetical protein